MQRRSHKFLLHLGHVAGPRLLVIWDGLPIHSRAEVKERGFGSCQACRWVAPLVHVGKDRTQQWTLVRLEPPSEKK